MSVSTADISVQIILQNLYNFTHQAVIPMCQGPVDPISPPKEVWQGFTT